MSKYKKINKKYKELKEEDEKEKLLIGEMLYELLNSKEYLENLEEYEIKDQDE